MRVVVVIQARMGSSRLPGKVLRPVGGRTMLEQVVRRCQRAAKVDEVVIATTEEPSDDGLVDAAVGLGVRLVRGSTDDVLARFARATDVTGADVVVRVTADCPLLDGGEIDRLLTIWADADAAGTPLDWCSNQLGDRRRIPRGLDVEVVRASSLLRAAALATDPAEREHVTPWFYRDGVRSRLLVSDPAGPDHSNLRLTVDTPADLALVQAVVARLGDDAALPEIAALIRAEPAIAALNADVQQKAVLSYEQQRRLRVVGRCIVGLADAGPGIGVGHATRVSALLVEWARAGGRAALRGVGLRGALRQRLVDAGVEVVDADEALAAGQGATGGRWAASMAAAAIVLDSYALDADDVATLRAVAPVVAIDDYGTSLRTADVLVHQGSSDRAERLFAGAPGRLLAGPPYLLLRRELREAAEAAIASDDADAGQGPARVVVTLGGADVGGYSLAVAEALARGDAGGLAIDVIAGPAMPAARTAALRALATTRPQVRVHSDVVYMAPLLAGALCAISAAGSTSWELAALGVPSLLVVVADNQRPVAACCALAGCAVQIHGQADGQLDGQLDGADVVAAAVAFVATMRARPERRAAMARAGRALVDGRGAERVIDAILPVLDAVSPAQERP